MVKNKVTESLAFISPNIGQIPWLTKLLKRAFLITWIISNIYIYRVTQMYKMGRLSRVIMNFTTKCDWIKVLLLIIPYFSAWSLFFFMSMQHFYGNGFFFLIVAQQFFFADFCSFFSFFLSWNDVEFFCVIWSKKLQKMAKTHNF